MSRRPICNDSRICFAKKKGRNTCRALSVTYENNGDCPFCKPVSNVTDGKCYPYDPNYVGIKK